MLSQLLLIVLFSFLLLKELGKTLIFIFQNYLDFNVISNRGTTVSVKLETGESYQQSFCSVKDYKELYDKKLSRIVWEKEILIRFRFALNLFFLSLSLSNCC